MATQKDSKRQERRTAKETGCKLHRGSGNKHSKDDMSSDGGDDTTRLRIETKITSSESFRVPFDEFMETVTRAKRNGQIPIWQIEFKLTGRRYWLTVRHLIGETRTLKRELYATRLGVVLDSRALAAMEQLPFGILNQPSLVIYRKEDAHALIQQQ